MYPVFMSNFGLYSSPETHWSVPLAGPPQMPETFRVSRFLMSGYRVRVHTNKWNIYMFRSILHLYWTKSRWEKYLFANCSPLYKRREGFFNVYFPGRNGEPEMSSNISMEPWITRESLPYHRGFGSWNKAMASYSSCPPSHWRCSWSLTILMSSLVASIFTNNFFKSHFWRGLIY